MPSRVNGPSRFFTSAYVYAASWNIRWLEKHRSRSVINLINKILKTKPVWLTNSSVNSNQETLTDDWLVCRGLWNDLFLYLWFSVTEFYGRTRGCRCAAQAQTSFCPRTRSRSRKCCQYWLFLFFDLSENSCRRLNVGGVGCEMLSVLINTLSLIIFIGNSTK